jgi:Uma2 family endonuclease
MSTITPTEPTTMQAGPASSPAFFSTDGGDLRIVFRGVDWHTYNQLSEVGGEGQHIHLTYDGKDLEIMGTGNINEFYKEWLARIVAAVTTGRDLDCVPCGETTWKTSTRGLEADLSYYFDPEKVRVASDALARKSRNPADYPYPDLAIEIDMSPPQVDRAAIYAEMGVFEVWRLIGADELVIEQLQADGSYAPIGESRFLHIRPADVLRWLNEASAERQATWNRRLNEWALGLGQQVG